MIHKYLCSYCHNEYGYIEQCEECEKECKPKYDRAQEIGIELGKLFNELSGLGYALYVDGERVLCAYNNVSFNSINASDKDLLFKTYERECNER